MGFGPIQEAPLTHEAYGPVLPHFFCYSLYFDLSYPYGSFPVSVCDPWGLTGLP